MLPARDIRVTSFGNRVQEAGAGVVSLGGIYADPIGAMRRALARRPEAHRLIRREMAFQQGLTRHSPCVRCNLRGQTV